MSATDITNEGFEIPTFIRLIGQLSAGERGAASANNLLIFVDDNLRAFFAPSQFSYDSTKYSEGCGGNS